MPRKPSLKIIRSNPPTLTFSPVEPDPNAKQGSITLLLEEWEALRLVDYAGLEQTEAALSMGISRQSVQMLLASARTKLARVAVEGLSLHIQAESKQTSRREILFMKRNSKMKIAVSTQNGEVFPHFGRTPEFYIVNSEDGKITDEKVIPAPAEGHFALVNFLAEQDVDAVIGGWIGGGAVNGLRSAGIKVYSGASGPVKEQVLSLLSGQLPQEGDAFKEEGGHGCGCGDSEGHEHAHNMEHEHDCGCGHDEEHETAHEGTEEHVHEHQKHVHEHQGHVHEHPLEHDHEHGRNRDHAHEHQHEGDREYRRGYHHK